MAYKNGQYPTSALRVLSVLSKSLGPQYAVPKLARAFEALNLAFKQRFGKELEPVEAYRWLQRQVYLWNGWVQRLPGFNLAARPGTSKHGDEGAIDFGSRVNIIGSTEHTWMVTNGPRFGFIWTGKDFRPMEGWHFGYNGLELPATASLTQIIIRPKEEDDMALIRNSAWGDFLIAPRYSKHIVNSNETNEMARDLGIDVHVVADAQFNAHISNWGIKGIVVNGGEWTPETSSVAQIDIKALSDSLVSRLGAEFDQIPREVVNEYVARLAA